jgi:CheY-like chemotaxis protein
LFQDFARRPRDAGTPEGNGLGLSINASLTEAMGGTIRYPPGPGGGGSQFIVELPQPTVQPPEAPAVALPAARPSTVLRVLVVDDLASNRRLAETLLQQAGSAVALAPDGAAALAALQREPLPNVVLMDVYTPGMDGLTATRRIRALPGRAQGVPIIAVTADASADRAPDYLASGMNSVVTKPIDIDTLTGAIAACLPRARQAEDAD